MQLGSLGKQLSPPLHVPLSSRTETFEGVIPIKKIYLEFHVVE